MMRPAVLLYALWCLIVVAGFFAASHYAYSPFADGARAPAAYGVYGPQHK